MVEILIGSQKEPCLIHKDPLCKASPYFDKMFNGAFKETGTQTCSDPDADSVGFRLFTHYVYAGDFPLHIRSDFTDGHDTERVIKFYILADRYLMPDWVKSEAMTTLLEIHKQSTLSPAAAQASLLWLDDDDPMGCLVIDLICRDYIRGDVSDEWLQDALKGVSLAQTMKLFKILRTSGWNGSSKVSKAIKSAKRVGVAAHARYSKEVIERADTQQTKDIEAGKKKKRGSAPLHQDTEENTDEDELDD